MLSCSNCNNLVHPDCAGLPEHVVKVALNYRWNCIECKKCTVCEKPDNEVKYVILLTIAIARFSELKKKLKKEVGGRIIR